MIINYPTLKTKTFKSDAYRCFNDLPLDPRKEINHKLISGAKSCFINKAFTYKVFTVLFLTNSSKRIVCATASILFLVYFLCMQQCLTIVLF